MAIYHFASTVASHPYSRAAYNSRENLADPEGNRSVKGLSKEERSSSRIKNRRSKKPQEWDFSSRRSPTVFSAIVSGDDPTLPDWAKSCTKEHGQGLEWRQHLQDLVDKVADGETTKNGLFRKNAQFFREIVVSLPDELSDKENINLILDFVNAEFAKRGMTAIVDIHRPDKDGDPRNIHAHILLTMRSIGPEGFGPKIREWNDRNLFNEWRESWANFVADHLKNKNYEQEAKRFRVAHLMLGEQYEAAVDRGDTEYAKTLNRPATRYKGVVATLKERKEIRRRKIRDLFDTTVLELIKQRKHIEIEAGKLKKDFAAAARGAVVSALKGLKRGPSYHAVRRRILEKLLRSEFRNTSGKITRKPSSIHFYGAAELLVQGRSSLPRKPEAPAPIAPSQGSPPVPGGGGSSEGATSAPHAAPMTPPGAGTVSTGRFAGGVSAPPAATTFPSGPLPIPGAGITVLPAVIAVASEPELVFTGKFEGTALARKTAAPGEVDVTPREFVMETFVPAALFEEAEGPGGIGGKSWGERLVIDFGREQFKRTTHGLNADITVHRIRYGEVIPNEYRMRVVVTTPPITAERQASLIQECTDKWERLARNKLHASGYGSLSASPLRPTSTSGSSPVSGPAPGENSS